MMFRNVGSIKTYTYCFPSEGHKRVYKPILLDWIFNVVTKEHIRCFSMLLVCSANLQKIVRTTLMNLAMLL